MNLAQVWSGFREDGNRRCNHNFIRVESREYEADSNCSHGKEYGGKWNTKIQRLESLQILK